MEFLLWKIKEKTIELKKISAFIIIKTRLSTVTINLQKNEKKRERNRKIETKYENKIWIRKFEIFWGWLVCNFGTLAKMAPYFTSFPYHVRLSVSVTVEHSDKTFR